MGSNPTLDTIGSEIVEDNVGLVERLDMHAFIGQNLLVRLVLDARA